MQIFGVFDTDGDGVITREDLGLVLAALGERSTRVTDGSVDEMIDTMLEQVALPSYQGVDVCSACLNNRSISHVVHLSAPNASSAHYYVCRYAHAMRHVFFYLLHELQCTCHAICASENVHSV